MSARALAPVRRRPPAEDPFATLNDEQRAAVFHGAAQAAPPLLIDAGAGTGKTLTLAARVARLVRDGADPQRLLLLTFSRRAAQAMQQRAGRLLQRALGQPATAAPPQQPWAGTFHGVAARLLREYAPRIGLSEQFTIADRADSEDLLGWVRDAQGFGRTHRRFPLKGTCLAIHSRAVNACEPLAEVLATRFPWCAGWEAELKTLLRAYTAEKLRQQVLDYDDLLLVWHAMLEVPALAAALSARFDHVLVDEYQDTNRLQAAILYRLKPDGRGLTVVGDDAQAIYSFRAAEPRNLREFPGRFEPPAEVLPLQRNYRSGDEILRACNAVLAAAPGPFAKTLWSPRSGARPQLVAVADEGAQAAWVADAVLAQREAGIALKRQAVLFRTGHHSAALELELMRRDIPYLKFGGLKFLEAAHVKDLLALLRWVQNPRARIAGFRVAQLVEGIGAAGARRLCDALDAAADPAAARQAFVPPPAARAPWAALCGAIAQIAAAPWPAAFEPALRWYLPQLERLHDDAAVRRADLELLQRLTGGHRTREAFLAELTLDPPEACSDEAADPQLDEDYLILSTIHSAKGLEWPVVYVLNVVDGCIPSDMAAGSAAEIEEERRLLYVAMTRAMHRLHLLVPQRFHVGGQAALGDRHVWAGPSRFLTPAVMDGLDAVGPLPASPGPASAKSPGPPETRIETPAGPVVDLGAALRARWD
ncbi:MAG: ATP-dependent helicase [Burkholderiales bacterium]|nr:ATP-dependent helicase [Burkholderiales bacterium]